MSHYRNFRLATYFVAHGAAHAERQQLQKDIDFFKHYLHLDNVYLEPFRDGTFASEEQVRMCKEVFEQNGIHVSGGITTAMPDPEGAEPKQRMFGTLCYNDEAMIRQLEAEGYEIEAVRNRGYRLHDSADILNEAEIRAVLTSQWLGQNVKFLEEIDSTNNEAKRNAENGAKDGTLYITESQTGGRGRRGRQWVSPSGSGIWMTLLLRPQINPANASMLTIVAAMAVTMAIRRAVAETGADVECHIKWPNDVVINKKKVCGILTEMSAELDCIHYVVIGIGINVNTTEFADEIKETASSLFVETGKNIKRSRIVALFAEEFTKYYQKFLNTGDLSGLVQDYNEMLINAGRQVRICDAKEEFTGVAAGIDSHGELLVTKEDGTQAVISAGEVSVRGLYGYV